MIWRIWDCCFGVPRTYRAGRSQRIAEEIVNYHHIGGEKEKEQALLLRKVKLLEYTLAKKANPRRERKAKAAPDPDAGSSPCAEPTPATPSTPTPPGESIESGRQGRRVNDKGLREGRRGSRGSRRGSQVTSPPCLKTPRAFVRRGALARFLRRRTSSRDSGSDCRGRHLPHQRTAPARSCAVSHNITTKDNRA